MQFLYNDWIPFLWSAYSFFVYKWMSLIKGVFSDSNDLLSKHEAVDVNNFQNPP